MISKVRHCKATHKAAVLVSTNKVKLEECEAPLLEEEKVLEGIRNSLKGNFCSFFVLPIADTPSSPQTWLKSSLAKSKSCRRGFSHGRLKSTEEG